MLNSTSTNQHTVSRPICLFDSGIGGLTVLKKLINKFPNENYIYLADEARVPYGSKTKEEIKFIVNEIFNWFLEFTPKMIIMACNTSSTALGADILLFSTKLNLPIYGMIESFGKKVEDYNEITIWATELVTRNNGYSSVIKKYKPNLKINEISCPKLVPMIEDLNCPLEERKKLIKEYLLKTPKTTEAIVLGCTHYPLIQEDITSLSGIKTLDPADYLLEEIKTKFLAGNIKSSSDKAHLEIYATANEEKVTKFSSAYLKMQCTVKGLVAKR